GHRGGDRPGCRSAQPGPGAGLGDPRLPHRAQGRPDRGAVGGGARRGRRGARRARPAPPRTALTPTLIGSRRQATADDRPEHTAMSIAADIIGTHYRYPDYFEVDREKIREFARAVKSDHPAHFTAEAARECGYDALIAPLTLLAVAGRRVQLESFSDFDVPINLERMMHRDQKIIFHRPVVAGDKLYFDSYLDSVIESHGTVITEVRGECTDADG